MRVLIGLAALAAAANSVNGAVLVSLDAAAGSAPTAPTVGTDPRVAMYVYQTSATPANQATVTPAGFLNVSPTNFITTNNFAVYVPFSITTLVFRVYTNQYVGQLQHRWSPDYPIPSFPVGASALTYTCDVCAPNCGVLTGPGSTGALGTTLPTGFPCASMLRTYTMTNLQASGSLTSLFVNSFSVQVFDTQSNPFPNTSSQSFQLIRLPNPILGDPQIIGLQGQDFQVHGVPDEIFNLITAPTLQVNARFVYLSEAECHDNFTACFAHPGTYISEEGIRVGSDKVHVRAGSFKKGLTVKINGQKITKSSNELKHGAVQLLNHRRVIISTPLATVQISNSDKFLNQETFLSDAKLIELGQTRRKLLVGESFHSEVPIHGLQGQTWRNVEYPSGLDYEGTVADYMVADGNLWGTNFVFNKFQL